MFLSVDIPILPIQIRISFVHKSRWQSRLSDIQQRYLYFPYINQSVETSKKLVIQYKSVVLFSFTVTDLSSCEYLI